MAHSFSKILTKTDTEKRLSVPIKFLKSLPSFRGGSHVVDFKATDERGKAWAFGCSIRKKGKYLKPVLSKGYWRAFVNSKKLKMGDKIEFYKTRNQTTGTPIYEVRVEKEIKILGVIIGYAPLMGL